MWYNKIRIKGEALNYNKGMDGKKWKKIINFMTKFARLALSG